MNLCFYILFAALCFCSKYGEISSKHEIPTAGPFSCRICPSICPTIDSLPTFFLVTRTNFVHHSPVRKLSFLTGILLLLSGDINLNPGPSVSQYTPNLRFACTNICSIRHKSPIIHDFVDSHNINIIAVTETWLRPDDTPSLIAEITPPGFCISHSPRLDREGGGVATFYSSFLNSSVITLPSYSSFQITGLRFCINGNKFFNFFAVYRPPGYPARFMDEFQDLLSEVIDLEGEIFFTGDFNLHLNKPNQITSNFSNILSSFNLTQHVNFETHKKGNWLDLVITHSESNIISKLVRSDLHSDHFAIIGELQIEAPTPQDCNHSYFYRNIKTIDHLSFRSDLLNANFIVSPAKSVTSLSNQLSESLRAILDKHAPLIKKHIKPQPPNPWVTPQIRFEKLKRRQLEKTWRKSKTPLNRSRFTKQAHHCNRLIVKTKETYYSNLVSASHDDPRKLWSTVNKILHRAKVPSLPDHENISALANSFGTFFKEKIEKIRLLFPNTPEYKPQPKNVHSTLNCFEPVSEKEIHNLITSSSTKTCDLDPIPTSLLKQHLDILLSPITSLVNLSLQSGIFPHDFKVAHVTPLLKKPSLPRNVLNNYRPVSNLNFISKIIEKVVSNQLKRHLKLNNLFNNKQSAYRQHHSTETALLKLHNDILMNMHNKKVTALTLLDLSAAFDTIDHTLLLDTLSSFFGLKSIALSWINSYLSNRSQCINITGTLSESMSIPYGVPQGSVLGPLLFSLYTTPLSDIIGKHNVDHHLYADDTQIYTCFSPEHCPESLETIKNCLNDVQEWMHCNKLKLNPDKTEFLLLGNQIQTDKCKTHFPCNILGYNFTMATKVKNLGFYFDTAFQFHYHISQVCKCCFYHIRDLRRIRKHLSLPTATALANALVCSRLDYCNSLFNGINGKDLTKLQRIQNCLSRVVTKATRFSSSVPLLKSLHWLPIKSRIIFKMCLLTFKALTTNQPQYLRQLLSERHSGRNLRSDSKTLLTIPKCFSKSASRSFSVFAPVTWNKLPLDIRQADSILQFKSRLKTYLFKSAYPP